MQTESIQILLDVVKDWEPGAALQKQLGPRGLAQTKEGYLPLRS
jgi:hypothetical protein